MVAQVLNEDVTCFDFGLMCQPLEENIDWYINQYGEMSCMGFN